MQKHALNRKKVNWGVIRSAVYDDTKGLTDRDSVLHKLTTVFKQVNDDHGGFQVKNRFIKWEGSRSPVVINDRIDSALKHAPQILVKRWDDIGYFRVPGGTTKNVSYVTQLLVDSLCKINPATIDGWIIDLRLNTGGNIWFMLTSLSWLIGEGDVGGIRHTDGRPDDKIRIKGTKVLGYNQTYTIEKSTCKLVEKNVPVVVLIGPKTASSAEGVALAFKGRKNTLLMGEPTAGLVTNNSSFPLAADLTLVLATGYMLDRKGVAYTSKVIPEVEVIGGDDLFLLEKDKKVTEAIKWLRSKF
jgi:C-terminal processing protease CtpA/Prc